MLHARVDAYCAAKCCEDTQGWLRLRRAQQADVHTWLLCAGATAGVPADPGAGDGPSPGAAAALCVCANAASRPMAGSCRVPCPASGCGGASRLRPAANWLVGDDPPGAAVPLPPPEPTLAGPTASAASAAAAASWTACMPVTTRSNTAKTCRRMQTSRR